MLRNVTAQGRLVNLCCVRWAIQDHGGNVGGIPSGIIHACLEQALADSWQLFARQHGDDSFAP